LSRNPVHLVGERLHREKRRARPLPAQGPDPQRCGSAAVQLLRTYPPRRGGGFPFAPEGERSVARGYSKVIQQARSLIYVEDQYLWSSDVAAVFAAALRRETDLRMIAVIPGFPDQDGRTSLPPNLLGREPALQMLRAAGGNRFAVYSLENAAGTPIYVHAKACVVDDTWACVGSDNANRRSWTYDSELSCAVLDPEGGWPAELRLELAEEHVGRPLSETEAGSHGRMFELFRATADALDAWYRSGRVGPRPPGQLRTYTQPPLPRTTRAWATPLYRLLYDPDGRRFRMRRRRTF
jgi:phosphatidylserine/phosphatidylglycerophosphate/cardiolipin synthase-like enzyme